MKDKVEFSLVLSKGNKVIKHIGSYLTLKEAMEKKDKRAIMPNQNIWIGKYINGILNETYK